MSKVKFSIKIDSRLIQSRVAAGGKRGTWMALDHLATVSKRQVPLDKGPLQNSCYVDVNDDGSEGTVSYDTPYAVAQHENTWYLHQRGRKAKYLEDPVNDPSVQSDMMQLAQAGMSSEMEV